MSVIDESIAGNPRQVDNSLNEDVKENFEIGESADRRNFEIIRCFVCDTRVQGRHYALATCKTQTSRSRIIEKLAELVGERYVVVISEEDVVCRSCANLINNLDRLESEMRETRGAVLRFLERKYSLAQGELSSGNEISRTGQPPQIIRSEIVRCDSRRNLMDGTCQDSPSARNDKSNVWMECDRCSYTTLRNGLVTRPRKRHNSGMQCQEGKIPQLRCKDQENFVNFGESENSEERRAIQTAPLEKIALISGSGNETEDEAVTSVPMATIQMNNNCESSISNEKGEIQLINLTNPSAMQFTNFLNDGTLREGTPLLMRVLEQLGVSDNIAQTNLVTGSGRNAITRPKENTTKQMMTLTEDGNLEMIAVDCWNEEVDPLEPNNKFIL